jgi:hypothetical protein
MSTRLMQLPTIAYDASTLMESGLLRLFDSRGRLRKAMAIRVVTFNSDTGSSADQTRTVQRTTRSRSTELSNLQSGYMHAHVHRLGEFDRHVWTLRGPHCNLSRKKQIRSALRIWRAVHRPVKSSPRSTPQASTVGDVDAGLAWWRLYNSTSPAP